MRQPKSLLRELARRVDVEKLAARFGRTPKTVQRWLGTAGPPKGAAADITAAYERSQRARAAAATRRAEQERKEAEARLKKELRAERAREAARTRSFEKFRKEEGPKFDGRTSGGHASLSAMIANDDPTWQAFVAFAESQGRTTREAYNQWYSPKLAKKKAGLRKAKRKKKQDKRTQRKKMNTRRRRPSKR